MNNLFLRSMQGTEDAVRFVLTEADLAVARRDPEGAVALLRSVKPNQKYFILSRDKMARIYLDRLYNRVAYAACYK